MRVYLAATRDLLSRLAGDGRVDGEWTGFAPLESVRAGLGGLGDDELEYALGVAAGEASAALGGESGQARRRLVLVADVDETAVTEDRDVPGGVVVRGSIELSDVDAILADDDRDSIGAAAVDELSWFAVQEIADLLA